MRAVRFCLLFLLACMPACAQEAEQSWKWYFAAFNSPSDGSGIFTRSGTARVVIDGSKVRVEFTEKDIPELKASYVGSLGMDGSVKGTLDGLFFHGPEAWNGSYAQMSLKEHGCRFEEIVLRSGIPDGSVLVLSRARGQCQ